MGQFAEQVLLTDFCLTVPLQVDDAQTLLRSKEAQSTLVDLVTIQSHHANTFVFITIQDFHSGGGSGGGSALNTIKRNASGIFLFGPISDLQASTLQR